MFSYNQFVVALINLKEQIVFPLLNSYTGYLAYDFLQRIVVYVYQIMIFQDN
jgi:hypothetical protein